RLDEELKKVELEREPLQAKMGEMAFQQGREISAAQAAAKAAGLEGFAAIRAAADATQKQLDALLAAGQKIDQPGYNALTAAGKLKTTNEVNALAAKNAEDTRKLREQVAQGWLHGDDLILAKERALEAALGDLGKHTLDNDRDLEERRALYREQADQETLDSLRKRIAAEVEITDQFHAQTQQIANQARTQELEGYARLYADEKRQLDQYERDYEAATQKEAALADNQDEYQAALAKLKEDRDARTAAVKESTLLRLQAMQTKAALETQQIETAAAIAILPPWERADAEIYTTANQRIQEINDLFQRHLIFQSDVAGRTAAVWAEATGKVIDSWTSAFENLFSGGWSQTIQNMARQFAARIAAELTLQSGLSGILGPILGLPSGIPGMTNAGFGATFGGSTLGLAGLIPGIGGLATGTPPFLGSGAGTMTAAASGFPLLVNGTTSMAAAASGFPLFVNGNSATTEQWIGAQPSGTMLPQNLMNQLLGVPALSGAGVMGGGKGLFSIAGLQSMLPLAGLFLGGKLGGTAGTIGGGMLGLMAMLGMKYVGLSGMTGWGASASAMWGGAAGGL
ncbi:MAG: hypothetical protein WCC59_08210, partial [Terriglobales bacterium]